MPTKRLPTYLGKQPRSRVIVETSTEAFFVADAALALGDEARVVSATLVRSIGVGDRGIKTDQRDAPETSPAQVRQLLLAQPQGRPVHLERVLQVLETLNVELKDADRELIELAEQDALCKRLMTVPSVSCRISG